MTAKSKRAGAAPKAGPRVKVARDPIPAEGVAPPLCPKCGEGVLVKDGRTPGGKQRWTCKQHAAGSGANGKRIVCYSTTDPAAPYRGQSGQARKPEERPKFNRKLEGKTFVITAAQNATPVHEGFLAALESYCAAHDAELIVIPLRYKNPTSRWTSSQENAEVWAAEVGPYLFNQRRKLNDGITLLGDLKIQPTAVRPLTGLEGLTHGESSIIGHTKLEFKTVATPQHSLPKMMTTTGAVTVPNYTDSRAGKQGEFHHILGAVVVEIESRTKFHLRHIQARKDGAFIELNHAYFPDGKIRQVDAQAIVFGDAHYRFADPKVVNGTFGKGGLVELLNPAELVWHDLLDAYAVTPHHEGNPMIALAKHRAEFNNIEREVRETVAWLIAKSDGRKSHIVPSNHDDMLSRWIMRADWKLDPENAEFYLETAAQMVRSAKMGKGGAEYLDPFVYWTARIAEDCAADNVKPIRRGQSLLLGGIECSMHGDKGPHGARGSVRNLSRLGVRVVSGHGHAPAIEEVHTRTGTMTYLNLEYNGGPSGWLNTHASIDAFGKPHLHHIIDGKFTTRKLK